MPLSTCVDGKGLSGLNGEPDDEVVRLASPTPAPAPAPAVAVDADVDAEVVAVASTEGVAVRFDNTLPRMDKAAEGLALALNSGLSGMASGVAVLV